MSENELSYIVRGIVYDTRKEFGSGLLESEFESVIICELKKLGFTVERQKSLSVSWDGLNLKKYDRADIIVGKKMILAFKSAEELDSEYYLKMLTNLKLTGLKLGMIVNLKEENISESIERLENSFY